MKPAVLNASPLIVLAKAGYLDLVPKIVSPVVIPRAVANEISTGGPGRSATWHLGQGESEVLEYARQNCGTVAVLDDKAALRVARALDIPLTGTLGIIVAAVQMKLLPSLSAAIDVVRACGLYVDSTTLGRLLMDDIKERS